MDIQTTGRKVLDEKVVEAEDDTPHEIAEFLRHYKDRPTLDNPLVLEGYARGDLHVLVLFRIPGDSEEFVALFVALECVRRRRGGEQFSIDDLSILNIRDVVAENVSRFGCGVSRRPGGRHRQQELVFVGSVEAMEDPEIVIPCLVWIERPDRMASLFADVLLYTSEATFECMEVPPDREEMVSSDGVVSALLAHEVTEEDVEGGPQVMYHIPKDQGNCFGNLRKVLDPTDHFPIRPILNNNGSFSIRLVTIKRAHLALEVAKVMLCPMQFGPRTPGGIGHF